jgi:hypothetical protein
MCVLAGLFGNRFIPLRGSSRCFCVRFVSSKGVSDHARGSRARCQSGRVLASAFWDIFWPSIASNAVAGVVLGVLGYWFVDRRLHLTERREAEERDRGGRWEIVQDVLRAVEEELVHNQAQAELIVTHAPEEALPYPAFETNGWTLIAQSPVFTAIHQPTLRHLLHAYNRFRSANDYYSSTYDFLFGSTAVLAVVAIESMADQEAMRTHQGAFTARRADMLKQLMERVRELQPHIDEALDRVRLELAGPPPD